MSEAELLWTPGKSLEIPVSVPTPEEFTAYFASQVWPERSVQEFINLDESLAVLAQPERQPTGYAFIDIDDCVVELGTSLRRLQYADDDKSVRTSHHNYGEGMFFDDADIATKYPLIRLVKNTEVGCVPTDGIDQIRSIMQSWRSAGIYVAFITSAIEGAELAAIDSLAKHFQKACDGIVVTSGHYQLVDKGKAATEIIDIFGAQKNTPAIHIDDLIFNTTKVRRALTAHEASLAVQTFQPLMPTHFELDKESHKEASTLAVFEAATEFFEAHFKRAVHIPLHTILQRDQL